ncbi:MAG TPA: hypothetical protein VK787_04395 [Puia sp.]|jgi:hypothetical protein|nr:hypothetical protein [Puia sp.]
MKKLFFIFFSVLNLHLAAQTNVVILEKNGENVKTYAAGVEITFETIYHQWFDGVITAVRHDSVFVNDYPFHYREIATIKAERKGLNYSEDGVLLMIAGGGVLLLNAVNGAYRGDKAKSWYTSGSIITAAALLVGGFLLTKSRFKTYHLGKKFTLEYLALDLDKK